MILIWFPFYQVSLVNRLIVVVMLAATCLSFWFVSVFFYQIRWYNLSVFTPCCYCHYHCSYYIVVTATRLYNYGLSTTVYFVLPVLILSLFFTLHCLIVLYIRGFHLPFLGLISLDAVIVMGSRKVSYYVLLLCFGIVVVSVSTFFAIGDDTVQPVRLSVNASDASTRQIPETLFGIFFEVGRVNCGFFFFSFSMFLSVAFSFSEFQLLSSEIFLIWFMIVFHVCACLLLRIQSLPSKLRIYAYWYASTCLWAIVIQMQKILNVLKGHILLKL